MADGRIIVNLVLLTMGTMIRMLINFRAHRDTLTFERAHWRECRFRSRTRVFFCKRSGKLGSTLSTNQLRMELGDTPCSSTTASTFCSTRHWLSALTFVSIGIILLDTGATPASGLRRSNTIILAQRSSSNFKYLYTLTAWLTSPNCIKKKPN